MPSRPSCPWFWKTSSMVTIVVFVPSDGLTRVTFFPVRSVTQRF
jgi:hypothetical protein